MVNAAVNRLIKNECLPTIYYKLSSRQKVTFGLCFGLSIAEVKTCMSQVQIGYVQLIHNIYWWTFWCVNVHTFEIPLRKHSFTSTGKGSTTI